MWDYTAQTSEWLRGLECFQSSVAQHLSPHGSVAAEETCGSCLVCPYLGMADELWQLMSEQPVKETACNEESAAWETDAIIFQIKLFPALPGPYWLWQAQCAGGCHVVGYSEITVCLFFWARGKANILALPTRVKMWLHTYSFVENAESGLQSGFGLLPVDEPGQSEIQSQTDLDNNGNIQSWLGLYFLIEKLHFPLV